MFQFVDTYDALVFRRLSKRCQKILNFKVIPDRFDHKHPEVGTALNLSNHDKVRMTEEHEKNKPDYLVEDQFKFRLQVEIGRKEEGLFSFSTLSEWTNYSEDFYFILSKNQWE